MRTVLKDALGIEHYWGRVKFAPGRGQIHLYMLGIAKDKAYLNDFYEAKTMEDKAIAVNKYARENWTWLPISILRMIIGTTFPYTQNHHSLESSVKSLMKLRMPGFYAKTACAIFVTDSACETTRKINHALVVLGLVMRHIMVDKIPPEWVSGKTPG